jgi:hypothetical protein
VAETSYTPFRSEKAGQAVRLIVRRVKPTPGSQLALLTLYDYHAFISDREGETLVLEADHRRHAEIENAIRDLKYGVGLNHLPSGKFAANGAWLAAGDRPQPRPLDGPDRPRRRHRHHEDAASAALWSRRAAYPLSAPAHAPPAGPLAVGSRLQCSPREGPGDPTPGLTAIEHLAARGLREPAHDSVASDRSGQLSAVGPRGPGATSRPKITSAETPGRTVISALGRPDHPELRWIRA